MILPLDQPLQNNQDTMGRTGIWKGHISIQLCYTSSLPKHNSTEVYFRAPHPRLAPPTRESVSKKTTPLSPPPPPARTSARRTLAAEVSTASSMSPSRDQFRYEEKHAWELVLPVRQMLLVGQGILFTYNNWLQKCILRYENGLQSKMFNLGMIIALHPAQYRLTDNHKKVTCH